MIIEFNENQKFNKKFDYVRNTKILNIYAICIN